MKLDGMHHITAITGNAPGNVDFYARVLGLRLVKKSVNQDDPTVYHLFYADENASPGADLTFFEYPGAVPGRAGAGMVHRIIWRVVSEAALDFWAVRLDREQMALERQPGWLRFADPEGLQFELRVVQTTDAPLVAQDPEIPAELAIQGFHAVQAFASDPGRSRRFLEETLGFEPGADGGFEARGERRGSFYNFDKSNDRGIQGAGTVHHVAWATVDDEDHPAWRRRVIQGGGQPTPIIDRFYFRSIYFREPSGVLFEIATHSPGFTADEPLESLGEKISLPPPYEHLRPQLEAALTPLPNPRRDWVKATGPK
jgi:glyoxalase family protein